uniref:Dehydrogenase/reductase SDR family member 11 n=1 Tax=Timema tahoe TaxID=61484 RepID=A0A7R9IES3_9NEOP|nr:unnamed protein product [Timema tahoe]
MDLPSFPDMSMCAGMLLITVTNTQFNCPTCCDCTEPLPPSRGDERMRGIQTKHDSDTRVRGAFIATLNITSSSTRNNSKVSSSTARNNSKSGFGEAEDKLDLSTTTGIMFKGPSGSEDYAFLHNSRGSHHFNAEGISSDVTSIQQMSKSFRLVAVVKETNLVLFRDRKYVLNIVKEKMNRWKGRVALVTGASAGIGEAIAKALVKQGMKVVGLARSLDRMKVNDYEKELEGEPGKFYPIKADMTKEEDLLAAFKWVSENLDGVDVLVNNAGVAFEARLLDGKTDQWRQILETNILGLNICTREAYQSMKSRGVDDGHIIHINSGYMEPHRTAFFRWNYIHVFKCKWLHESAPHRTTFFRWNAIHVFKCKWLHESAPHRKSAEQCSLDDSSVREEIKTLIRVHCIFATNNLIHI